MNEFNQISCSFFRFDFNLDQTDKKKVEMALSDLPPNYSNGVFGNVYLLASDITE